MFTLLNPASFVLGLIAWLLPVVNILRYKKLYNKNWYTFSIASMGACAISLYFQILYYYHLIDIKDWSAMMDTIGALVLAASALIGVTVTLNIIVMFIYHNRARG